MTSRITEITYPDGTVYMTLPAPRPSTGDLEGWHVRTVLSVSKRSRKSRGTRSVATDDVSSFNNLLRLLADMSAIHNYRAPVKRVTGSTFRWTWESEFSEGQRVVDMIIASKIG